MAKVIPKVETFAKIKVIGVGGSGNNAVSYMIKSGITGVDFIAINTDAQALHNCLASEKLHIGKNLTRGLGAGMNPEVGRQAAEENKDEIFDLVKGADMIFITCGMGGGTGTSASSIIAEAAREAGALTVAVVTKPFGFEGNKRREFAEAGIAELRERVDSLITIPNDRLLGLIDKKTSLLSAFSIVDDVLRGAVQGLSDLITMPGLVNVDFADIRAIMKDTGTAIMGVGRATGETRALDAAKQAINNPLLEISIDGAKGVLFNVTSDSELAMQEINEVAEVINESIDPDAKVIFGAVINEDSVGKGELKVTVIATGFKDESGIIRRPIESSTTNILNDVIKRSDVVRRYVPPITNTTYNSSVQPKDDDQQVVRDDNLQQVEEQQEEEELPQPTISQRINTTPVQSRINKRKIDSIPVTPSHTMHNSSNNDSSNMDEEDLEIPAFIRRKMKI